MTRPMFSSELSNAPGLPPVSDDPTRDDWTLETYARPASVHVSVRMPFPRSVTSATGVSVSIRMYVGMRYPPSVLDVRTSTPSFASESGMTLIMSNESSDVTATYPSGTVRSMATATIGHACLVEKRPAQEKYLLDSETSLPYAPWRILLRPV